LSSELHQDKGVPTPVTGVDIRELPLEPAHAFVLSRVDGQATVAEISSATGLTVVDVEDALRRLAKLGAVDYASLPNRSERPPTRDDPATGDAGDAAPVSVRSTARTQANLDLRATVEDLHSRFRDLNHYQLLGVPSQATRAAIRTAYYELVALLHPDRHSKKRIGDVRGKMEELVSQITKSYEILKHKQRRAEYDEELEATRPRSQSSSPPKRHSQEDLRDAQRQRLRRGLASSRNNKKETSGPRISTPDEARERAAEGLKRISVDRVNASEASAQRLKDVAEEALRSGDVVSAANAMKARASLDSQSPILAQEAAEFEEESFRQTVDQHLQQARGAERGGDRDAAALAYERAARGRPNDGELWDFALTSLLDAKGDARHAVKMGQRAVLAAPNRAKLHVLLARAYQRANMPARAQGEISRATKIEASNPMVKAWAKRIKRGES
jgi:curved DNA-binding protein CbpA